jgi:prepilin-type N-terminal cleavage/methylation domain-containing protein
MKIQKITKKAFSIIEIAVVLAIIGILLASVIIGKNLVDKSKITNSQTLTINSVVHSLDKNLVFWHETSFGQESYNNNIWFDYQQDKTKNNNAGQISASSTAPSFITEDSSLINNLPTVRFADSKSLVQPALTNLSNSYFTIFVIHTGTNDTAIFTGFNTAPSQIIVDGTKKLSVWRGQNTSNIAKSSTIGSADYVGDIYEIIVFNTQLTNESQNEVIAYLTAKYKFKTKN